MNATIAKEKNEKKSGQKYAELLCDFMFKRLFGSESNKDVLIDFLNMILQDHEMVDIPQIFQTPDFKRLFILSEIDNFTAEEYSEYQKSLTRMSDYYNIIESAEKRAREEGREEARTEVARKMLQAGMDEKVVADLTGLSIDSIRVLL